MFPEINMFYFQSLWKIEEKKNQSTNFVWQLQLFPHHHYHCNFSADVKLFPSECKQALVRHSKHHALWAQSICLVPSLCQKYMTLSLHIDCNVDLDVSWGLRQLYRKFSC